MTDLMEPETGARRSSLDALFRRTRLPLTGPLSTRCEERVLRAAGMPLLMAAVVAGGPGWTSYLVEPGDTLGAIAKRHGTDAGALARLNGVNDPGRLEPGARLTVPVPPSNAGSTVRRRAAATGLHPVDSSGAPTLSYRVRDGDTVGSIAARTGNSVRAVLAANGLRPTGVIRPGQILVLPSMPASARAAAAVNGTPVRRPARVAVHRVRPGDTVSQIAQAYGIPTGAVLSANRMRAGDTLVTGRKLVLPGVRPRAARPAGPTPSVHVVRRGDTVTAIARKHGISVPAVLRINHLGPSDTIVPGRRLLIPVGAPADPADTRRRTPRNTFLGRTYPESVVSAADANRRALSRRAVPGRDATQSLIRAAARRYGVDPALALAVGHNESGFDQRQVSPANAVGVMQVIPSAGAWASDLIDRRLDLLDAQDNVTAGVVLLATLIGQTHDPGQALAGYYQGLSSVRKHGMFADTRRYVATVRTLASRYR